MEVDLEKNHLYSHSALVNIVVLLEMAWTLVQVVVLGVVNLEGVVSSVV